MGSNSRLRSLCKFPLRRYLTLGHRQWSVCSKHTTQIIPVRLTPHNTLLLSRPKEINSEVNVYLQYVVAELILNNDVQRLSTHTEAIIVLGTRLWRYSLSLYSHRMIGAKDVGPARVTFWATLIYRFYTIQSIVIHIVNSVGGGSKISKYRTCTCSRP